MVVGQVRPTTSQTLHLEDLLGREVGDNERPLLARACALGSVVEGEVPVAARSERARVVCIPVRMRGDIVAVLTREAPLIVGRRAGELERVYVGVFDRLARMVAAGTFPFPVDEPLSSEAPRVGDGVMTLDGAGRIEFSSPNAVNALHRLGIYRGILGASLAELGLEHTPVPVAFNQQLPVSEELELGDVAVFMRCIPLLDQGKVTGALLLVRDVTDLRRRDRLLLGKDVAIREVHHRVKNNLQTISSLLRLQARRLPKGDGRHALEEAERRVRSIAVVHEILSRDTTDEVDFNDILAVLGPHGGGPFQRHGAGPGDLVRRGGRDGRPGGHAAGGSPERAHAERRRARLRRYRRGTAPSITTWCRGGRGATPGCRCHHRMGRRP